MFTFINQLVRYWLGVRWWLVAGLLAAVAAPAVAAPLGPGWPRLSQAPRDTARPAPVFARRRLVVQIDSRYSIINGKFSIINGVKLGLEWRGRVRTGAAFYFLSSRIPTRLEPPDNAADEADATLRFYNVALYGEYIVLENPRWELGANLQGGMGAVRIEYNNEDYNRVRSPRDFIALVEPSMAAQMRLFSWASLGAGAGWRQPLFVPELVRREISGPVFYVRAKVLIGPLIRVVRNREPLFSQKDLRIHGVDARTRQKFYE
ncbi:hypothetical protein E4631_23670 [Hymenobacter sp. UV11]|uniref:hypothetical protein n=1 Tax=Hymenobacter sp. UV11 TaxID=1849735 RepID=UPI00105E3F82|nr:hypothetical protein [Hymenobacter sp. UV11]TDN38115.1 hypothetical protein A8B98_25270 [Hymenobacter sp. UV11]TFZ63146.1 hypothetical protein E4631_23670 [Hymenobacter sp. UV11]